MKNVLSALLLVILILVPAAAWAGPVYALRDGRVYADGARLDWEVRASPGGRLRHWTVWSRPGEDEGENVVVFFNNEGRSAGELVFEGQFRDLIWNPDGSRLALAYGSGVRPDIFYTVYGADLKPESEELSGLADNFQWLDPARLVYVRTDGIRENGAFPGLGYGLELSVVLYDCAARRETPLRTATDTANFYLASVAPDGRMATLVEESVAAPADWGVEDKIKTRELEVPVPAAKNE